jgi:hypothetical protein
LFRLFCSRIIYRSDIMITTLQVNDLELVVEYELDVSAVYFGDLESEYIEIDIQKVVWLGNDVLPLIQALEMEETLKLILRDKMEDYES